MKQTGKKQRSGRAADILFSALFILALVSVLAATVLIPKEPSSVFENRDLAEWPAVEAETLADGSWFQDAEAWYRDHAALRVSIQKLCAWADLNLFHRPVVNGIVHGKNGTLLPFWDYEADDPEKLRQDAEQEADQLVRICSTVQQYGGTFLYAAVPSQTAFYADCYPSYLQSPGQSFREKKDVFFPMLDERGVPWIDLTDTWQAEGMPDTYISRVDHHWTLQGAMSGCETIMKEMNRLSGGTVPLFDRSAFNISTLENPYLGSRSRYLCGMWHTDERLQYAEPVNPVPFHRWNWENRQEGYPVMFAFPELNWTDVQYTFYMGGDASETIVTTDRPELPSLLITGDSFTNLAETMLYLSFDEMRSLDLRYYETMSLADYVSLHQPDAVLILRDYEALTKLTGNGRLLTTEDPDDSAEVPTGTSAFCFPAQTACRMQICG